MRDGKPNLINYDLRDGTYIIPKVMDNGYVELGKKKDGTSRGRGNVMADTVTAAADAKLTDHTTQPKGVLQKNLKMFLYLGAVVLLILATVIKLSEEGTYGC